MGVIETYIPREPIVLYIKLLEEKMYNAFDCDPGNIRQLVNNLGNKYAVMNALVIVVW